MIDKQHTPLFIVALLAALLWPTCASAADRPNVLLIAIDDLNDYIGLLRGDRGRGPGVKTPNLDRFAATALSFTHAYCAAPSCNPSRTALLSGVAPWRSGIYENGQQYSDSRVAVDAVSMPQHFHDRGYRTMTSGKIYHTQPPGMEAMWDDMENIGGGYGPQPTEDSIPAGVQRTAWFNYQAWTGPDTDFPDVRNAAVTAKRLTAKYEQPFFLAHGIYRPHNPWTAPKRFFDLYPLESLVMPIVPDDDLEDVPAIARAWAASPVNFEQLRTSGYWKHAVQSYLASISFMDETFGRIIDALDSGPHKDNTIVIVFSDHGFHMGEKRHFTKFALWELTTHVPLMIRAPGVTKPGQVCDAPVTLLDIYPTLVDLCGLSQPATKPDGRSFAPLVREPAAEWVHSAVMAHGPGNFAVRDRRWRYIRYADGSQELYDHMADPNEWKNLAADANHAKVIQALSRYVPEKSAAPAVGDAPKGKNSKSKRS